MIYKHVGDHFSFLCSQSPSSGQVLQPSVTLIDINGWSFRNWWNQKFTDILYIFYVYQALWSLYIVFSRNRPNSNYNHTLKYISWYLLNNENKQKLFWGISDFHSREKYYAPERLCFPHSSEYLPLCSEQTHSYRFGNTWGWVNDDRIFLLGWTIPLSLWITFCKQFLKMVHTKICANQKNGLGWVWKEGF